MRKQFTIFLILTFILGLSPINFADAITKNQIDAEVQIVCPDNYGNWYSGSGTIIDPKGIILTNKHVVSDQYGGIIKTCFIGFTESINQEPNFGTQSNPNLAEVKYYTNASDMDAAILYLNNPTNKNYTYVDIWNSNSNTLQFGHKIEAIGFPSIGGSTITYTSGDFSGFGSASDGTQNYIKATTPLEHGNSGGAAYNPSGQFIGIPTMVVAGTLNSLSYILSVNSIKSWLSGVLGSQYKEEVIKQTPSPVVPTVSIQDDITPPYFDSGWFERFYTCPQGSNRCDKVGGDAEVTGESNMIYFQLDYHLLTLMEDEGKVESVFYSYSKNISDLNNKNEIYFKLSEPIQGVLPITQLINLNETGKYYIGFRFVDSSGNISDKHILSYNYLNIDKNLTEKIKGRILLQVEKNGEAWYVYPKNGKRYYMASGNEAHLIMRFLGIGISNKDLERIKNDKNFALRHKGKIFLQVEKNGEAYYIDFSGNAHYLKDGTSAYNIMRDLGLGITTNDLMKISYGVNEDIEGYLKFKTEKASQERIGKFKKLEIDIAETDLCDNVYYIFYKDFNPNQISLCGIKLGDNKNKIVINSDDTVNDPGWIYHWNGTSYVNYKTNNNDIVVEMQIDFGELINKINSFNLKEEDTEVIFGKPDEIKAKGLKFLWGSSDKILTVTISNN